MVQKIVSPRNDLGQKNWKKFGDIKILSTKNIGPQELRPQKVRSQKFGQNRPSNSRDFGLSPNRPFRYFWLKKILQDVHQRAKGTSFCE